MHSPHLATLGGAEGLPAPHTLLELPHTPEVVEIVEPPRGVAADGAPSRRDYAGHDEGWCGALAWGIS